MDRGGSGELIPVVANARRRPGRHAGAWLRRRRRRPPPAAYWREGGDERGDGPGQAWATDIITFRQDFDPTIVAQFYVTVHFQPDDECTMTWMTGNQKLTGSWTEFMEFLKVDFQGEENAFGMRPHAPCSSTPTPKDRLQQHYIKKGVLPTHLDIMHRVFRNSLFPPIGNKDEVHGHLAEMLVVCEEARTKETAPLDIAHVMFHELWNCIMNRKADYLVHDPIKLRIKDKWANPSTSSQPMDTDTETAVGRGPVSRTRSSAIPSWAVKLKDQIKTLFCMQAKGQYQSHVAQKENRQRRKRVLRTLDVAISSGSEDDITPESDSMRDQGYQWTGSDAEEQASEEDIEEDRTSRIRMPQMRLGMRRMSSDRLCLRCAPFFGVLCQRGRESRN
ncbi:hypothetical protein ZWY2020_037955 [Hordeum vulgare]|nr:hypothetical protein ZWY2020_037955 [Hordeum vulgare]